jgi:tetratricopeptide (TPR) repeat protein
MKIKLLLLIVCMLNLTWVQSQTGDKKIDSIYSIIMEKDSYNKWGREGVLRQCTEMYYTSKELGNEKGQLLALSMSIIIYNNAQNDDECLKRIPEALELATKLKQYILIGNIHVTNADIYIRLGIYKEAQKSLDAALAVSAFTKDIDKAHQLRCDIYRKLANMYDEKVMNPEKSLEYNIKAYKEAKEISAKSQHKDFMTGQAARILGSSYIKMGKIKEGEKYLDEAETILNTVTYKSLLIPLYRYRGDLEDQNHNYQKALDYYNKAIILQKEYKNMPEELAVLYKAVAKVSGEMKDYKTKSEFTEKASNIKDSVRKIERRDIIKVTNLLTEEKQKKEKQNNILSRLNNNEILPAVPKKDTAFFTIQNIIVGISVLAIIGLCIFLIRKNKNKKLPISEIDHPYMKDKDINSEKINNLLQLAYRNDQSFNIRFSETFPDFRKNILDINPQITESDLEFAALLKLNFDNKQISRFKDISIRSVESKKYRLRKKLRISPEHNIYIWLLDK